VTQNRNSEKAITDILRDKNLMNSQPRNSSAPGAATRMGANGARMQAAAAKASRQRALLARALRANAIDEKEGGKRAGRLNRKALPRAMAGAANVFTRRTISAGFDTDVTVLLDASGSMSGHNLIAALEAGLVIAQAAGSVGAACTTEIFNSTGYTRAGSLASKRTPNPAEFGALQNSATGGTPLSAHMARAAISQAKRAPQKRRVLFVVTDGGCDWGPMVVQRMANYLEKTQGTIMAHVSIGNPLTGAFKAEVLVPCGVPLSDVGVDHFVKVLQAL
jgi:Mg-chelatase subunit ChlD